MNRADLHREAAIARTLLDEVARGTSGIGEQLAEEVARLARLCATYAGDGDANDESRASSEEKASP